ncbi:uncharacterized protein LOC110448197 [Mizuhopecten yessoensis]|uniref:Uncharacterized protein n=1 Tax=Mizuhopecten yessoensis TaxID=6573 RepID=A0A210QTP2_MIZYE|nr:uncharacterized protein LOC110448197 [Mizuhopecten yessoensis]OWF52111.1 hypothetical protein KP79_PYT23032 [Mizuhopecten yessoensis]
MAVLPTKLKLKDFIGSEEEICTQYAFKWIAGDIGISGYPMPEFFNLIIVNSNAAEGTSLTDASIYLQLIEDARELKTVKAAADFRMPMPCCGTVLMKDVINTSIFEKFAAEGVKSIEKLSYSYRQAFLILFKFLREKKRHGKSIQTLTKRSSSTVGNTESNAMAALALHLFSQLVPDKIYEVDKLAKHVPTECECGCQTMICSGNTSVGSMRTWHGRVDIVLNNTVAVAVRKEITGTGEDGCTDAESEDSCTDEDEPVTKKRKANQCDICVKEELTEKPGALLDEKFLKQILAEAITNSFAQANMQKEPLSHFLIPTFGASSEEVSLCLYDSVNDHLLHIIQPLRLWSDDLDRELELDWQAIVVIWLFLNFDVFMKKDLHASISLEKSGLHEQLKGHLEYYRQAETKQNFTGSTPWNSWWQKVIKKPLPKLEVIPDEAEKEN